MSVRNPSPRLAAVKSAAMLRLAEPETDQVIIITAQGTHVGIAMAIAGGTNDTWIKCLRDIADELEAGVETADDFFDELAKQKN